MVNFILGGLFIIIVIAISFFSGYFYADNTIKSEAGQLQEEVEELKEKLRRAELSSKVLSSELMLKLAVLFWKIRKSGNIQ